MDADKNIMSTH